MQYFKLEHSINPSEIGIFDQVQKFQVDPGTPHPFMYIPSEGELDPEAKFPLLYLEPRAKWTDFLHFVPSAGNFLLVSPKVLSLLQRFDMDVYQSYKVEVAREKEAYPYHLLRFPWSRNRDYIDWGKSVFGHTTQFGQDFIQEVQFANYDAFYAYKKPLFKKKERLGVEALFFKEEPIKKDVFRLLFISSGIYLSERIKDVFQEEGITGCRFVPLSDLAEGLTRTAMIP